MIGDMHESPINPQHRGRGAHMSNVHGWNMPHSFSSLHEEHTACRTACGIFDISHMGKFHIGGSGALEWIESVLSNTATDCPDGCGQTSFLLRENGSVMDRLLLFRENDHSLYLLGHAARAGCTFACLLYLATGSALQLQDMTRRRSGMALSGPDAERIIWRVLPGVSLPGDMEIRHLKSGGDEVIITHAGIIGGSSYEIWVPAASGIRYYEQFISLGAVPCGTATQDYLRHEAGIADAELDLRQGRTPIQAGLGCYCSPHKDYPGAERLRLQRLQAPLLRLVSMECKARYRVPLGGDSVTDGAGLVVGSITSASYTPDAKGHLALAYLLRRLCSPGSKLYVLMQGHSIPAVVRQQTIR